MGSSPIGLLIFFAQKDFFSNFLCHNVTYRRAIFHPYYEVYGTARKGKIEREEINMKKLIINILTIAIAAVTLFGGLIAYDEYKEAKKREIQRIERCEKNDQVFEAYLDHRFAEYAIGCFNDGYTLNVTFTYYDGITKHRAEWSNLNEDSFARLLESGDYKKMHVERLEYGTYVAQYDSWRA